MNVLVIGQGAVGRALVTGLAARKLGQVGSVSVRWLNREEPGQCEHGTLRSFHDDHQRHAGPFDAVIYAGGPAGEAACRRDPERAFTEHYTYTQGWVEWVNNPSRWANNPPRRLILIGTVQTEGYYGALKALAADWARDHIPYGHILHLRCGQIIGPEMPVDGTGVVATWVRQAVAGTPLRVHPDQPAIEITRCVDLLDRIAAWLAVPATVPWEEERVCLPDPVPLWPLAALCRAVADEGLRVDDTLGLTTALVGMVANARAPVTA